MTTVETWSQLARARFVQWLGKGNASVWIMGGTLTLAAASSAYLNPPNAHALQPRTATHAPAPVSAVYPAHHCEDGGFGGY